MLYLESRGKSGTAMLFLMIPRVIGHIRIPQLVKKVYPLHPSITGLNYERAQNVLKGVSRLILAPCSREHLFYCVIIIPVYFPAFNCKIFHGWALAECLALQIFSMQLFLPFLLWPLVTWDKALINCSIVYTWLNLAPLYAGMQNSALLFMK